MAAQQVAQQRPQVTGELGDERLELRIDGEPGDDAALERGRVRDALGEPCAVVRAPRRAPPGARRAGRTAGPSGSSSARSASSRSVSASAGAGRSQASSKRRSAHAISPWRGVLRAIRLRNARSSSSWSAAIASSPSGPDGDAERERLPASRPRARPGERRRATRARRRRAAARSAAGAGAPGRGPSGDSSPGAGSQRRTASACGRPSARDQRSLVGRLVRTRRRGRASSPSPIGTSSEASSRPCTGTTTTVSARPSPTTRSRSRNAASNRSSEKTKSVESSKTRARKQWSAASARSRPAGGAWTPCALEPVVQPAGGDERVRRRQVAREPCERAAALADEVRGQRAIAVERGVAPAPLDDLERDLVSLLRVGGELPGGFAAVIVQRCAKLAKAHEGRFVAGPRVIPAAHGALQRPGGCSFAAGSPPPKRCTARGVAGAVAEATADGHSMPPALLDRLRRIAALAAALAPAAAGGRLGGTRPAAPSYGSASQAPGARAAADGRPRRRGPLAAAPTAGSARSLPARSPRCRSPVRPRGILSSGLAVAPAGAPVAVQQIIAAGNRIARAKYVWGGGHRRWEDRGYDCSGSVSYALHGAACCRRRSSAASWRAGATPGPGRWVTIYANAGPRLHGRRRACASTRRGARGTASRWQRRAALRRGFKVRHPAGL